MTVYTDYGYGKVETNKFLEQLQESQLAYEKARQPILEFVK